MDNFYKYSQLEDWFSRKPKDRTKGKVLRSWCNVAEKGKDYHVTVNGQALAIVGPDETIEFVMPVDIVRQYGNTLTGWMHQAMPFFLNRKSKGRYEIGGLGSTVRFEYFPGIKFNLLNRKCLNGKDFATNKEVNTQWLRALRKFKTNIKVRARVGALDGVIDKVHAGPTNRGRPRWASAEWTEKLYIAIRDNNIDSELLDGFVRTHTASAWLRNKPTPQEIVDVVNKVCDEQSFHLRLKFGALYEMPTVQSMEQSSQHTRSHQETGVCQPA